MENLLYLGSGVLAFFLTNWIFGKPKSNNLKKYMVINSNGWYSLDWDKLQKEKEVVKLLTCMNDLDDKEWRSNFIENYFEHIHYRNNSNLLSMCIELHKDITLRQDKVDLFKRLVTASSIIYGFSVPSKLWYLDSTTITFILKYIIICKPVAFNIDNSNLEDFEETNSSFIITGKKIVEAIPLGIKYISYSKQVNIVRLFNLIRENKNLFSLIDGDINNLRLLMTVCYALAGLDIPGDYLCMNRTMFMYLLDPLYFGTDEVKYLKIVK